MTTAVSPYDATALRAGRRLQREHRNPVRKERNRGSANWPSASTAARAEGPGPSWAHCRSTGQISPIPRFAHQPGHEAALLGREILAPAQNVRRAQELAGSLHIMIQIVQIEERRQPLGIELPLQRFKMRVPDRAGPAVERPPPRSQDRDVPARRLRPPASGAQRTLCRKCASA